ncbi:MFS transporter [Telmatospirillum sp. J64-1]|uniref:MFS transporter n=1 Tax=Telmatospirillum sp. J64-1 TaxID=2502183 RepID=UPI00163DB7E2|nr:MFS transporter [Telmatospirillum sp. J64-1]
MRMVLHEGLTTQAMTSLTSGIFLSAYALQLGASNTIIGLLAAIPFLAQLVQVPSILLIERVRMRKLLTVGASVLSRLFLFVIALTFFLPPSMALYGLVGALILYAAFGAVGGCSWNSWMRDLLPSKRLGNYFSRRLFGMTLIGAILSYGAGRLIDQWQTSYPDHSAAIYNIFFAVAGVAGLIGAVLLSRTPEPRMPPVTKHASLTSLLVEPYRNENFRKLMMFLAAWSFAVNLASPFFVVYMLQQLHLSMQDVILLTIFSQVANMAFLGTWGRLADRTSNKTVLSICGPLYILCFLGWTFTTFPDRHAYTIPLLFLLHGLMGIATAGVLLTAANIALKLSPEGKATPYLAMNGMISALASGLAPIIGGMFADFFSQRQMTLTVQWESPWERVTFDTLSFQAWDFFFAFACVLGLYSMHRLSMVHEEGQVDHKTLVKTYLTERRRAYSNISSVAGLRWLAAIPSAELLRAHEKRLVQAEDEIQVDGSKTT